MRTSSKRWRLNQPGQAIVGGGLAAALLCCACHGQQSPQTPAALPSASPLTTARMAAERGDSVRAEQYFVQALAEGEELGRVLPELLQLCIQGGQLGAALGHAEAALEQRPSPALRLLVAELQSSLGLFAQARLNAQTLAESGAFQAASHRLLAEIAWEGYRDGRLAEAHILAFLATEPPALEAEQARLRLARIGQHGRSL